MRYRSADVAPEDPAVAEALRYKLKWKVDNSDGDSLRYRVFSKLEQSRQWRALLRESEVLTANDYNWNTDGVPDGYYRVRVQASDELDNPGNLATQGEGESEPFLIDNHPPSVSALRVEGGQIKGRAQDSLGPIAKLEYSVDGLEWKLLSADDDAVRHRRRSLLAARQRAAQGQPHDRGARDRCAQQHRLGAA